MPEISIAVLIPATIVVDTDDLVVTKQMIHSDVQYDASAEDWNNDANRPANAEERHEAMLVIDNDNYEAEWPGWTWS